MKLFTKVKILLLSILIPKIECQESDQVFNLPGLKEKINFRHYSGYLTINGGKYLHYWFVESESKPRTDPLLLWLNGGPGCSSMEGMLSENGPFKLQSDGQSLIGNKYSWNKIANVLYLESPVGVGFSYSLSKNYTTDDDQVSEDNLDAIQSFFKLYPEYKTNEFYITGESYSGVYIPTLAVRLLNIAEINFKGFAIGNGYLDVNLLGNSRIFFSYYHGFIDEPSWNQLTYHCCSVNVSKEGCNFLTNNEICENLVAIQLMKFAASKINPYNIYAICSTDDSVNAYNKVKYGWQFLLSSYKRTNHKSIIPCTSEKSIDFYMNQVKVREALHISPKAANFTICNEEVSKNYKSLYKTQKDNILKLLKANKRGIIYNGDIDIMCDFLGDQWFVESLQIKNESQYLPWFTDNQTSGFYKKFDKLTLVTIRGSGHMVPTDKPSSAFEMIKFFLEDN